MKKQLLILCIVVGAILTATTLYLYMRDRRYEVVIDQAQIDATLAKTFPATKKFLRIFEVTYSNPMVVLLEHTDRIQIGLDATLNLRLGWERRSLRGNCTLTTGIRFDPETQQFFLTDARINRLAIQGIPEKQLQQITEVASVAAQELVETKPVYRLRAKNAKTAAAKWLLKSVEVKGQAIHATLGL